MTPSGVELLAHARAVLSGTVRIPAVRVTRAAAFLARQALEEFISDQCQLIDPKMARASGRSKLIVLQQLGNPDTAAPMTQAWAGLSQACHRHAYELQPTAGEVADLVELVGRVIEVRG